MHRVLSRACLFRDMFLIRSQLWYASRPMTEDVDVGKDSVRQTNNACHNLYVEFKKMNVSSRIKGDNNQ